MKKDLFKILIVKFYPILLTSSIILFLLFMVLGFAINNEASNVLFALSFACLLGFIPSFLLLANLQKQKWFIKYNRCFALKYAKEQNKKSLEQKAQELLRELNIEN